MSLRRISLKLIEITQKKKFKATTRVIQIVRKKNRQQPSLANDLKISWKHFCDGTKLAGLNLIGGHRKSPLKRRLTLLTVWMLFLSIAIYKSVYCVKLYFQHDIKTVITYDLEPNLQFPALTFCNIIGLKKSVIGINDNYIRLLSYTLLTNPEEFYPVVEENLRTCLLSNVSSAEANRIDKVLMTFISDKDSEGVYRMISTDSNFVVKKCWWNNRRVNCSNIFLNHQIDGDVCFTFNQNQEYIDYNKGGLAVAVYGENDKKFKSKIVNNFGPSFGLKLLLDVHQEEYCLTKFLRTGAGLRVFVHDSQSQSTNNLDSTIQLSPGYEYSISLTPISYDRRNFTEWLGKCTSNVYNFLKPDLTDYTQESCFASCFAEAVFRQCKCLPVDDKRLQVIKKSASNYLRVKLEKLVSCELTDFNQRNCWLYTLLVYRSQNPDVFCPKCQRSCLETKYDFRVTSKKISKELLKTINDEYPATNRRIENSFIVVSFTFDNLDMINVREVQAYSSVSLYRNIGGALSLFIGFSTVSIYELVHQLLISASIILRRCLSRKNKVHPRRMFVPSVDRRPSQRRASRTNRSLRRRKCFLIRTFKHFWRKLKKQQRLKKLKQFLKTLTQRMKKLFKIRRK